MKKKKITTIEDLGTLVQEEFISMRSEMSGMRSEMNKRFDKIEKEIRELR